METRGDYMCVNCGAKAPSLYKQHSPDVLRLYHCKKCENIVDKYVEYDTTIILIDIILQQHQAYRHILFNAGSKPFWKIAVILLLCDSYVLWINQEQKKTRKNFNQFQNFQLDWDIYIMALVTLIELVSFVLTVLIFTQLIRNKWRISYSTLVHAMIVGSCGKLMIVPALIWGQSGSYIYLGLTSFFVWLSLVHVYQAVCGVPQSVAFVTITCSQGIQYLIRCLLLMLMYV
uniref:Protein ARV n=1 Tax=Strigamia maritima TaxID=126957 RepID=T1JLN1_STRMM